MPLLSPLAQGTLLETICPAGVEIAICPVSGGVWLERGEYDKFDSHPGPCLPGIASIPYDQAFDTDTASLRVSPLHPDTVMERHVFGPRRPIEVDVCPRSGGIWIDRPELCRICTYYPDENDITELAGALAHELVASGDASGHEEHARRLANLFRWLCPERLAETGTD